MRPDNPPTTTLPLHEPSSGSPSHAPVACGAGGTPPCPDAPPAPGYPPLAPRFPPAFTAFDVSSAVVFDGLAALLPPAGLATFQDSFVRYAL
jgi:hypothetical protein